MSCFKQLLENKLIFFQKCQLFIYLINYFILMGCQEASSEQKSIWYILSEEFPIAFLSSISLHFLFLFIFSLFPGHYSLLSFPQQTMHVQTKGDVFLSSFNIFISCLHHIHFLHHTSSVHQSLLPMQQRPPSTGLSPFSVTFLYCCK